MANKRIADFLQLVRVFGLAKFYVGEPLTDFQYSGAQLKSYFNVKVNGVVASFRL